MAANPTLAVALLVGAALLPLTARAQQPPPAGPSTDPFATAIANAARTAQTAEHPARLVFANRTIVEFRATVLSRTPSARAAAAVDVLERLVNEAPGSRIETQAYENAIAVRVGPRPVFFVFAADVDPLAGERLAVKAAEAAARLQVAFDEGVEVRTPRRLVGAAALALLATIIYVAALWLIVRVDRRLATRLGRSAERQLLRLPGGEALARVADTRTNVQRALTVVSFLLGAFLTYAWLAVVLRRFPYTRPWGESLRGALFSMGAAAGGALLSALPSLFTVAAIVLLTRLLTRLASMAFVAVEQERITLPWIHPDTAPPTRRIVVALLWLFALVVAYPYLPGSQSEVFKGVSVFVGLIVSLGSTGVMNQLMSGLMVTYSRALRCGDFVRVGDIEGTVTAIGSLATKIRTPRNEEVTIPNAVVVSHATTNYSRNRAEGVYASTSVTIGYDTPWRQVQALLLLAARRTLGVQAEPKPVVLQTALHDFYVEYMLFVALEQPHRRFFVLDTLHAHIQDAFNEYGVQIMSPRYVNDPRAPKIVPPQEWYSAPAAPPASFPSAVVAGDRGRGA
jgi:small-conductance mechanosensitive channel